MEYRVLGRTGLQVSRIAFGVYSLTGLYGPVDEEEAVEVLRAAERLGVNFYDTADVYGYGLGESLLCRAFGERGMSRVIVATKIGYDFYTARPPRRRYDGGFLLWAAERSAERLCKKPIDIIQIHNPPLEALRSPGFWRAVGRLVEQGYARFVGVALGPEADVLEHALAALEHSDDIVSLQFVYNMLEQEPGATIARLARLRGLATLVRVPHAGGVLDETVKPGEAERLRDHRRLRRRGWYEWAFETYREMRRVLEGLPGTPGQKAIRFILDSIDADVVVVAARNAETLEEYVGALTLPRLDADVLGRLRRIYFSRVGGSPEKPVRSLRLLGVAV